MNATLDHPLRNCRDEALVKFFDLLNTEFESLGSARAWVCYRESEMLFDRFAVQSAKRRLVQAMDLAATSGEYNLYWLTVQQKLFYRIQQIYGRQDDWLRDALEVAMKLAKDDKLAAFRTPFAQNVAQVIQGASEGPFKIIALELKRFGAMLDAHRFLIAAYALWTAAMRVRVLSTVRTELESFLRSEARFLRESDFD